MIYSFPSTSEESSNQACMLSLSLTRYFQLQSSDSAILSVNSTEGTVQGVRPGTARVQVMMGGLPEMSEEITVSAASQLTAVMLDPIIAALRLNLDSAPRTRLMTGQVSLDVLSELSFFRERVEVTASAILDDGRRIVITDPSELEIEPFNTSVVSVEGNYIVAEDMGTTEMTVRWIACGTLVSSSVINVTVNFDRFRPVFDPENQQSSVPENSPTGHLIATVEAFDQDLAGDVQYRFQDESYSYGGLFTLDPISGEVAVGGLLDREVRDSYLVVVEATDRQQRLAEQAAVGGGGGGGEVASGSGSGTGSAELLVPDAVDGRENNVTISLEPPATLMVTPCSIDCMVP